MANSPHEQLVLHANGLFVFDDRQRITGLNQFDGGTPPQFYLGRSSQSCFGFTGQSVAEPIADQLKALVVQEPPVDLSQQQPPKFDLQYRRLLSLDEAVLPYAGPVYSFPPELTLPQRVAAPEGIVAISAGNAELLEKYLPDWLPDVAHRYPFLAAVESGHAVAVCASVRMTHNAHEAGVETHPAFRGRGHAARVVSAWAKVVAALGAEPVYSTHWDNIASRAVAATLKLQIAGVDYHF